MSQRNCTYYIEDKNGDGMGACAIVEGIVAPEGWCVSYARYEGDSGDNEATGAVAVPGDARCAVCDMNVANFPDWNAQAIHSDGTREFFCTTGCATTYYAVTEQFADTPAAIDGLWVTDRFGRAHRRLPSDRIHVRRMWPLRD